MNFKRQNFKKIHQKDTEILAGNIDTLYAGGGKLGPRQHLSHPIPPKCFHKVTFYQSPVLERKSIQQLRGKKETKPSLSSLAIFIFCNYRSRKDTTSSATILRKGTSLAISPEF